MDANHALKLISVLLLGGWSAFLMNKGIANFHDGLRPVMPEWLAGRMSRRELAAIAFAISLGFVVGISPLTLATGIILTHIILLPTDVIGAASPNWPVAAAGGVAWSALVFFSLQGFYNVVGQLPVNFLAPLALLAMPLVLAFTAFPAVAVGFQFGAGPGVIAVSLSLLVREVVARFAAVTVAGTKINLSADGAAMLTGMLVLVWYAISRDLKARRTPGATAETAATAEAGTLTFGANVKRLRGNIYYLMVQGALLAFATRLFAFSWTVLDATAVSQGKLVEAAIVSLALAAGFFPLIATTALTTGVYQAVGLCLVFPAAYLSPNPWVAAVAGAIVFGLEILLLGVIGQFLDRYPSLREAGDSLRGAMEKVVTVALIAGSMVAADKMMPGGGGYFIVAGLVALNELTGQRIYSMATAPMAAIGVGILANILVVVGIMPKPQ